MFGAENLHLPKLFDDLQQEISNCHALLTCSELQADWWFIFKKMFDSENGKMIPISRHNDLDAFKTCCN